MSTESKKKNYTFKCPKCGCKNLTLKTRLYIFNDVESISERSIVDPSLRYYSYDPSEYCMEQPDEAYGEVLCCDNCGYELVDIETEINNKVIILTQ